MIKIQNIFSFMIRIIPYYEKREELNWNILMEYAMKNLIARYYVNKLPLHIFQAVSVYSKFRTWKCLLGAFSETKSGTQKSEWRNCLEWICDTLSDWGVKSFDVWYPATWIYLGVHVPHFFVGSANQPNHCQDSYLKNSNKFKDSCWSIPKFWCFWHLTLLTPYLNNTPFWLRIPFRGALTFSGKCTF